MKEYKTITVAAKQGWPVSKVTVDLPALDAALNQMAREGWELHTVEDLNHTGGGTGTLLCIFTREAQP